MKILKLESILKDEDVRNEFVTEIKQGLIFIYPTDTVYGIGCDATNEKSVKKIRELKQTDHPFSVIIPAKSWIKQNLLLKFPEFLEKLPGPFTFIFKKKSPKFLDQASSLDSIGIRIPKHSLTKIIQSSGVPFVSTSANISGQPTIKEISDLPDSMKENVDVIIDGGRLANLASTVVDLTGETPKYLR